MTAMGTVCIHAWLMEGAGELTTRNVNDPAGVRDDNRSLATISDTITFTWHR